MRSRLAAVAAVPLVASLAAPAQASAVQATARRPANVSDFSIPTTPQFTSQSPLQDGMIAQEELSPNAHLGLGLAPMLGRNVHSVRIEHDPVATRNPGVTLVFRFPG